MRKLFTEYSNYIYAMLVILCDNNEKSIKKALEKIKTENLSYKPSPLLDPKYIAKQLLELM